MARILIVEDEVLIAGTIERYLRKQGHESVGNAISYEEAVQMLEAEKPDLILLDIRLNGEKTGIDVAQYIREKNIETPFIFLTSQMDRKNLEAAKATLPDGYLMKPIHKQTLFTTIEITLHNTQQEERINLSDGQTNHNIALKDIVYLEAEHVYTKVFISGRKHPLMVRRPLSQLQEELPKDKFLRTHRSYIINVDCVESWNISSVTINEDTIPISRSNKETVLNILKKK